MRRIQQQMFNYSAKYNYNRDFQNFWDTFWRVPIPASASLSTFQMGGDPSPGFHAGNNTQPDLCYQVLTNNSQPTRNVYEPGAWDDRDSGTNLLTTFRIPDAFVLPDASPGTTPNNPTMILNTDTGQCLYLNGCARPVAGGNIWGYIANRNSTHGGSYISGGETTLQELNGTINHALAILVNASKYLSPDGTGYVPPAFAADSGYAGYYGGTNVLLKMGTRLAIPSGTTAGSLGISSAHGLALLQALKTYGAYVVDDSFWDAFYICTTPDAASAISAIPSENAALFGAMQIVT